MSLSRRSKPARSSTPPAEPTPPPAPAIPGWVATIAGLGALLTAAGAIIAIVDPALLLGPGDQVNHAVRVYAGYLFSRNLALAAMLIAALLARSRRGLADLMVLTAAIQGLDTAVDATTGRWTLVPGLLVFTTSFLLGARRLADQPRWRTASQA